jgi:predicted metal-dependent HD superfamily phosphohydrolase
VALCDADLAILAAAPDRYAEYTAGVREEYAELSDAEFRAGRLTVLRDLATRESLFGSAYSRVHWESRARENLRAEIEALGG